MNYQTFTGKTVDDAINKAIIELGVTSSQLDFMVIEKGYAGILGIGSKPAVIEARAKQTIVDAAEDFLSDVFENMKMNVFMVSEYNEEEHVLNIDLQGDDMGILIGKRGQTLDSLQYLTSLVVNKESEEYIRVKLDIENYRERREESLENLARSCAAKVKRSKKAISLEPMNPYERRIIHACLQSDRYVVTSSEGEDPYRHVVISLKRFKDKGKQKTAKAEDEA
ncbi:MAG: protein jag [Lachnospiraceae bacterium]|nr:protein jag [Lachnospiraceae bacterium]